MVHNLLYYLWPASATATTKNMWQSLEACDGLMAASFPCLSCHIYCILKAEFGWSDTCRKGSESGARIICPKRLALLLL